MSPNPVLIGIGRTQDGLKGPAIPPLAWYEMTVSAVGQMHGRITQVTHTLRDVDTGQVLGTRTFNGPFLEPGNTPCRPVDPLLRNGRQHFVYTDNLGFAGRNAVLTTDVQITDQVGKGWSVSAATAWELFPTPASVTLLNAPIRQNDPTIGCAFDTVHGYGYAIDLSWTPVTKETVYTYTLDALDGTGTEHLLATPQQTFYQTKETSAHIVRCGAHIGGAGERGAKIGVNADHIATGNPGVVSGWAIASFDFQSCRDAGVPACR